MPRYCAAGDASEALAPHAPVWPAQGPNEMRLVNGAGSDSCRGGGNRTTALATRLAAPVLGRFLPRR
jgi:hypothetical protein